MVQTFAACHMAGWISETPKNPEAVAMQGRGTHLMQVRG
jgi:hypothetical protein